jgi:hypothetical protein
MPATSLATAPGAGRNAPTGLRMAGSGPGVRTARRRGSLAACAVVAGLALSLAAGPAHAVEGGASFFLLGGKLPLSGVVPGPGVYFQNDMYFYSGDLGGSVELPIGGQIIANVEGFVFFEAPTILTVLPHEILGGRVGFGLTVPSGYSDVQASLNQFEIEDDVFTIGDPIPAAMIGWDSGNFHWSLTGTLNVPIGDYQEGGIAQIALHRWAGDISAGLTWLDPATGWELSGLAGVTFNGENLTTDYNSGNEFHAEAGVIKHFNPAFSLGLLGYYNHQISPDSGSRLGAFEGEVGAIGGMAEYNFAVSGHPVTARAKYFHEVHAVNRLQGDAVFLTLATPLWVPGHAAPDQAEPLK